MNEKGKPFRFKQFSIWQENVGMKVGLDGILLGAWADITHKNIILDVGTGTGLVALMIAQRAPKAQITAIEIEPKAAAQAKANVAESPWYDRLQVVEGGLQDYSPPTDMPLFNLIVSNPPYFHHSLKTGQPVRDLARHSVGLTPKDLIHNAAKLLCAEGKLVVILPFTQFEDFIKIAEGQHLYPEATCMVSPRVGRNPIRALIQLGRHRIAMEKSFLAVKDEDGRNYTPAYQSLTMDYHTIFEYDPKSGTYSGKT